MSWRVPQDVAWHSLDDGGPTFAYRVERGEIQVLSASAYTVWAAADGLSTPGNVVETLSELLGVEAESISDDVRDCLDMLLSAGLLEEIQGDQEKL